MRSTEHRQAPHDPTELHNADPASWSFEPVRGWVSSVREFARPRAPLVVCELCNAPIQTEHSHVVEVGQRKLLCCCPACALLFGNSDSARYRVVPKRAQHLADFILADEQWDALALPIDLAFFVKSTPDARVIALYPSPAGSTESKLGLEAWQELVRLNPVLDELQPDVEALLVHRADGAHEYFRAPIDQCYALVGLIRAKWQGVSGGIEVRQAISNFFAELKPGAHMSAEGPSRGANGSPTGGSAAALMANEAASVGVVQEVLRHA